VVGTDPGEPEIRWHDEERDGQGGDGHLDHADRISHTDRDKRLCGQLARYYSGTVYELVINMEV
jgi:hypothetical protein